MATKNNIFEDLARVSTSVATVAFESVKNVQDGLKGRAKNFAASADLVSRDEFEVVRAIVSKLRVESEQLVKDSAEFKQQIRLMRSTIDLLKSQGGKIGAPENNGKIIEEIERMNSSLEARLNNFEIKVQAQVEAQISSQSSKVEGLVGQQSLKVEALIKQTEKEIREVVEAQKAEIVAQKAVEVAAEKPVEVQAEKIMDKAARKAERAAEKAAAKLKRSVAEVLTPKKASVAPANINNSIALLNNLAPQADSGLDLFGGIDISQPKKNNN